MPRTDHPPTRNIGAAEPSGDGLVILHTGTTDLLTGRKLPAVERRRPMRLPIGSRPGSLSVYLRRVEDLIDRINSNNLNFPWKATKPVSSVPGSAGRAITFQPNVCMCQIHAGRMFRGARLYTRGEYSVQSLPKKVRRGMLIGGEPAAELDFSGMAVRMLYHMEGLNIAGDVYRPEAVFRRFHADRPDPHEAAAVRGFVKKATIRCLNVLSPEQAVGSVNRLLSESARSPDEADRRNARLLWRVMRAEGFDTGDVVGRIRAAHPDIRGRFFTGVMPDLQTKDGAIMLDILTAFADAGRPAVSLHDGVLCRRSDADSGFAERVMDAAYRENMGWDADPVIQRVY